MALENLLDGETVQTYHLFRLGTQLGTWFSVLNAL